MSTPAETATQVRFALSQIPAHSAHHTFEEICRHLTRQFICSNVLPATGPVSAGGDQGRDFETFRSYLSEELGPHGSFLGRVSKGTIAFVCTTQAAGLNAKIASDVAKVVSSGHAVQEIKAFTLEAMPVARRHELEERVQRKHDVRLEILDAEAIAELLSQPEGFWIAEQFLSLPSEVRPSAPEVDGDLAAWYLELRGIWRQKLVPNPTLGDLIDLKAGLREATFRRPARADLPFWLGLTRELLASPESSAETRQRARYELIVATLRGLGDLRPVDELTRSYLSDALSEMDPARLQDASVLLLYANGAAQHGVTDIAAEELADWNQRLRERVELLTRDAAPHATASLLFTLGHLGTHPLLEQADLPKDAQPPPDMADWDDEPPSLDAPPSLEGLGDLFPNLDLTMAAWTDLAARLDETPLFPVDTLSAQVQWLTPLLIDRDGWRRLVDLVDVAVDRVAGRNAVAERARDRAMALLRANRLLDAIGELHQAKIDWWAGDTIRGSLMAMMTMAHLYLELRLPMAAKALGLAVASSAASTGDDELADLVPSGLLMAAHADFASGAWCGATELFELGLTAQHHLVEDGLNWEKHKSVQDAMLSLTYVTQCAREVDVELAATIEESVKRVGLFEIVDGALDSDDLLGDEPWADFGAHTLTAPPFSDLGDTRTIRISALGTQWTILSENDAESARAAERFAAAAEALLGELAAEDLCITPTSITVMIDTYAEQQLPPGERLVPLGSNDGRRWGLRLRAMQSGEDLESAKVELTSALTYILLEASLLPWDQFRSIIDDAFRRGLGHKLSPARLYDELAMVVSDERFARSERERFEAPWTSGVKARAPHPELAWREGPGPGYSSSTAHEMLANRYRTFGKTLQKTVPRLGQSSTFRRTLDALRDEGWLDWHILTAIANVVLNYRHPLTGEDLEAPGAPEAWREAAFEPETESAEIVPVQEFSVRAMNQARHVAMLSLVAHWGLACQQRTPDFPGIERLLAARYGYWIDDIDHEDPFFATTA